MITKKCTLLIALLSMFIMFNFGVANAAYIDLRPNGTSMSANGQLYNPNGNNVSIDVWIMPSGDDAILEAWSFDILYDTSELTYTGGENYLPPGAWFTFGDPVSDVPPYVQFIEGLTMTEDLHRDDPDEWQNGWHAATLNFSIKSLVYDNTPDVEVYYRGGQGLNIVDTSGVTHTEVKPISIGPDIAAVPIPAAVWLLGSGVVGLLGLRRRLAA